ncbi:MAG TPA: TIGR03435 family protein [Acidobacteriaceae bacterium]|nr:TIGR03435 family protein [Acidobacteriaceae bacterium]
MASIHPHQGPLRTVMGYTASGPRVRLEGYNLRGLIMEAYDLKNFQVSMPGIDEQENTYYDIIATAADGTSPTHEDFRQMLQTLLADRFQLKAHFEKKQSPVYALVVSKAGPKFPASTAGDHEINGVDGRNQFLEADRIAMPDLANAIWNGFVSDRPVIDRTRLTGTYKLRIEATPEFRIERDPQPGDLSIFTAVQEQLGLKLEPATAQLDVLVINSVQQPSSN